MKKEIMIKKLQYSAIDIALRHKIFRKQRILDFYRLEVA